VNRFFSENFAEIGNIFLKLEVANLQIQTGARCTEVHWRILTIWC